MYWVVKRYKGRRMCGKGPSTKIKNLLFSPLHVETSFVFGCSCGFWRVTKCQSSVKLSYRRDRLRIEVGHEIKSQPRYFLMQVQSEAVDHKSLARRSRCWPPSVVSPVRQCWEPKCKMVVEEEERGVRQEVELMLIKRLTHYSSWKRILQHHFHLQLVKLRPSESGLLWK